MVRLLYTLWNPAANLRRDPGNAKPSLALSKRNRGTKPPLQVSFSFSSFCLQSSAFSLQPSKISSQHPFHLGGRSRLERFGMLRAPLARNPTHRQPCRTRHALYTGLCPRAHLLGIEGEYFDWENDRQIGTGVRGKS